jgi:hypothetical protein
MTARVAVGPTTPENGPSTRSASGTDEAATGQPAPVGHCRLPPCPYGGAELLPRPLPGSPDCDPTRKPFALVNQSLPISPQRRRGTAYSRGTNASVALETRSSAVGAAQSTRPRETRALRDLRRVAGAVRDRHLRDLMDGLRGRVTVDLGATFRPALRDAGPCFHIREVTRPTLVSVIVVRAGASHDPGPGLFNLARQLNFDWADDRQFFERSATLFGRSGPPTTPWS